MSSDTDRWLVVGLGNPEPEYAGTRHNVGAEVVTALADRFGAAPSRNRRTGCRVAEVRDGQHRVVLALPAGYMNVSGGPVQRVAAWYDVRPDRMVVVHDDIDLPVGALRLKQGGGTGGHRGLDDIDRRLGSREYLRVRIGVGRPPGRIPARDHVLRPFRPEEREEIEVVLEEAGDAALSLIREGLQATQNRYHTAAP